MKSIEKIYFLKYIFRRILMIMVFIFGILTFSFILIRFMNIPTYFYYYSGLTIQEYSHLTGHDLPIFLHYAKFLIGLFSAKWGNSVLYSRNTPVIELISRSLPITIDLIFFSLLIASFIGFLIGIKSASQKRDIRYKIIHGFYLIGSATPLFFLGLFLKFLLTDRGLLPFFPDYGYLNPKLGNPTFTTGFIIIDSLITGQFHFVIDYLKHMALPIFCLSILAATNITEKSRKNMVEVLKQDYIRTA
ncbi:MAG: ABC transporter permease, partial [Promethearchaeota archaeon]